MTEEAIKNALSAGKALSLVEQAMLIGDILDELFGFGPLGLFIRDRTLDAIIEMSEDGSFSAVGKAVDIGDQNLLFGLGIFSIEKMLALDVSVFDDEEHKEEILARVGYLPKCKSAKDNFIEYKKHSGVGFRLPESYKFRKSRQEILLERIVTL